MRVLTEGEAAHLRARIDQLARCVRIQREALKRIGDTSRDPATVLLARETLREARW